MSEHKQQKEPKTTGSTKWEWLTAYVILGFGALLIATPIIRGLPLFEPYGSYRGGHRYGIQNLLLGLLCLFAGIYLLMHERKKKK